MKPAQIERLVITGLATAMVLWTGCLTFLWGWAFDTSEASSLIALCTTLLAVALTAPLPVRALHAIRGLLAKAITPTASRDRLWAIAGIAPNGEVQNALRLMAVAAVLAVAGGLLSTGAVFVAASFRSSIARSFLWDSVSWHAMQFVVQLAAMLPMGLATAVLFQTGAILSKHNTPNWAAACRFWLLGLAGGLLLIAALWLLGVSAIAGAMIAAVGTLGGAIKLFLCKPLPTDIAAVHPVPAPTPIVPAEPEKSTTPEPVKKGKGKQGKQGKQKSGKSKQAARVEPLPLLAVLESSNAKPIEMPATAAKPQSPFMLLLIAVGFAVFVLTMLLQGHMLRELAGAGPAARALWTVLSALLLTMFLRRVDERPESPDWEHGVGAAVGIVAAIALQWSLAWACGSAGAWLVVIVMLAGQPPLAALGATVISRHRQLASAGGASAQRYLTVAMTGAALGVTAYAIIFLAPFWPIVLYVTAAGFALALLWAIWRASKYPLAAQWTGWSAAILLSAVGALACTRGLSAPAGANGQSESVTRAVRAVMAAYPGRWWVTSSDPAIACPPGSNVQIEWSTAAPFASPDSTTRQADNFFLKSQTEREVFDGVYFSAAPADSADGWRNFNSQTLQRCAQRAQARGIVMVRTQTDAGNLGAAITTAKTFHAAVGDGWAVIYFGADAVDMLLVSGPAETESALARADGAFVVPIEKLWKNWGSLRIAAPFAPAPFWQLASPNGAELQEWLKNVPKGP